MTLTDRKIFEYIRLIDIYFRILYEDNGINKLCGGKSCNKIFDQRILGEEECIYKGDDKKKKKNQTNRYD